MNREQTEKDQAMRLQFDYWDEDELDRIVLVVPDDVAVEPFDISWLYKNSPFECTIKALGDPISGYLMEIPEENLRMILKKMITYGTPVIHRKQLEAVNSQYLSKERS